MRDGFLEIGKELKREYTEVTADLALQRETLSEIMGFEDQVKGFDLEFMTDESIDFLDVYA